MRKQLTSLCTLSEKQNKINQSDQSILKIVARKNCGNMETLLQAIHLQLLTVSLSSFRFVFCVFFFLTLSLVKLLFVDFYVIFCPHNHGNEWRCPYMEKWIIFNTLSFKIRRETKNTQENFLHFMIIISSIFLWCQ